MDKTLDEYWNMRKGIFRREIGEGYTEAETNFADDFFMIGEFNGRMEIQLDYAPTSRVKEDLKDIMNKTLIRFREEKNEDIINTIKANHQTNELKTIREIMTDFLIGRYHLCTLVDTEEIYAYNELSGLYEPSEVFIKKQIQRVMDKAELGKEVSSHFINETMEHIRRKSYMKREVFEAPPYYIPLRNCIIDIRPDGEGIIKYSPTLRFLSKIPITYNPNAKCPYFDAFLNEVLDDDLTIGAMWQIIGYLFYRGYPVQRAFMFVGGGSNGKSVLLKVFEILLGIENVSHLSLQQIETEKFAINALNSKYANIHADLSSQEMKSTGRFKMLTGGDSIEVEKKFAGTYALTNYAKLLFSCNQIPRVNDDADGFFRRWIIITFRNQFIEGINANPDVIKEITTEEEKSGIFNKSMMFLLQLLRKGTFIGDWNVEKMRDMYIRLSDSVASFGMDKLEYSTGYLTKKDLYNEYQRYCSANKIPVVSEKTFFIRLNKSFRLEEQRITLAGVRQMVLTGIKWKEDDKGLDEIKV